ncbi:TPA: glutamyl-tRNA amidotransferase [Patescibacteria group bacterium]|nr:glutamyl-tRNA amidotransferase [Patescibacteria group bacterium]
MNLKEQISEDIKNALKAGDSFTAGVLRMVVAALQNKSIEKRGKGEEEELTQEEILEILAREAKKRKEAIELYKQGDRQELADNEEKELAIIEKYLPQQMSKEEVVEIVSAIIEKNKPENFGEAMKLVMAELKGKADGKMVAEVIKDQLG